MAKINAAQLALDNVAKCVIAEPKVQVLDEALLLTMVTEVRLLAGSHLEIDTTFQFLWMLHNDVMMLD